MDHEHFDTLARRMFSDLTHSRRAAVATLLGTTLLRRDPDVVLAKMRTKATTAAADACFPNTRCTPGKGRNNAGCDFSHSTLFTNKDVRGANISNANFFAADLRGADLRGANLSGSCFVGADLTGAKLGSSVNLHDAVFCHTTMPNGTIDDRGCAGETPCCHQRLQSCPDAEIGCYVPDSSDICGALIDTFGPVGHCYSFPSCCPCEHPDFAYWTAQCNTSFPAACNGQCVANDGEVVGIRCFQGCLG